GIGQNWVGEFGTSADKTDFKALIQYSPYHNIDLQKKYPAILVTSGWQDERMKAYHARKFVARLQGPAVKTKGPILLRTRDEGHSGSDAVAEIVEEESEDFSFLMDGVGLTAK